jgi:hypothetical protein
MCIEININDRDDPKVVYVSRNVSILSIMTKQVGIKGNVKLVLTGTGGGISPSGPP